jgi:hypothetical protein
LAISSSTNSNPFGKLSRLKRSFVDKENELNDQIDQVKAEIINENQSLKEQMMAIKNEYKKKMDAISSKKNDELKSLIDEINSEHDVIS